MRYVGVVERAGPVALACVYLFCQGVRTTPVWSMDVQSTSWKVQGEIVEMTASDFNGDGKKEIIVSRNVFRGKEPNRYLEYYELPLNSTNNFQDSTPAFHWEVGPDAVVWDTGREPRSDTSQAIYYLASDGLWLLSKDSHGMVVPKRVLEAYPFIASGQEDSFLMLDFIRDWNGDGKEEVLIPLASRAQFYGWGPDGSLEVVEEIPVRAFCAYNTNVLFGRKLNGYHFLSVFIFPLIVPTDLNGDGRKDMLVIQRGRGYRYIRSGAGRLEQEQVTWDLDIRTVDEVVRRKATLAFHVADLNNDGKADVVVHKVSASFHDWNAETAVFQGYSQPYELKGPTLRFYSKGFLSGVSLDDLDGDGCTDMTIWSVKMGLWPLIEILLRKVVRLESAYHYCTGEQLFVRKPDYTRTYEFRIETSRPDFFLGVVPSTDGDFNSDGTKDLISQVSQDTIGIYLGRKKLGFEQTPAAVLTAPNVNYVKVDDLDKDGSTDLFAYQAQKDWSYCYVWLNTTSK